MTLSQSALSELLYAIRAGGGLDLAREAYRLVAQELFELEATTVEPLEVLPALDRLERARWLSATATEGGSHVVDGLVTSAASIGSHS